MAETPPPVVLDLIICDQIITDRITGKQSLIGMYRRIHATNFPTVYPQMCVFVSLNEGYGQVELMIRIVDANEERKPLVEGRGKVEFQTPRAITNLVLQFHGLRIPEPGEYRVQIWAGTSLLREARLEVLQAQPRPPQQPPAEGEGPVV
jgi:hypothetical protein